MMRIARFMKVSRERFEADWAAAFDGLPAPYDALRLPERATAGSAGYDFYSPLDFELKSGETLLLPTGVRARIDGGWVLLLFPRSGLGFKYRLQLNNTVGVIDSDYFSAKNEGHIFLKLYNAGDRTVCVRAGEAVAQGAFVPFGITEDDACAAVRTGGFGSTDSRQEGR